MTDIQLMPCLHCCRLKIGAGLFSVGAELFFSFRVGYFLSGLDYLLLELANFSIRTG